jgi:hypothetical protein
LKNALHAQLQSERNRPPVLGSNRRPVRTKPVSSCRPSSGGTSHGGAAWPRRG